MNAELQIRLGIQSTFFNGCFYRYYVVDLNRQSAPQRCNSMTRNEISLNTPTGSLRGLRCTSSVLRTAVSRAAILVNDLAAFRIYDTTSSIYMYGCVNQRRNWAGWCAVRSRFPAAKQPSLRDSYLLAES